MTQPQWPKEELGLIEVECEQCGCPLFVHTERDENGNPWWCNNCVEDGT